MSGNQEVDELFDIKNAFYTGSFQNCIKEAQKLKCSDPASAIERDAFMYRAYIAMKKFGIIRDEIRENSPSFLKPLKTLSLYFESANSPRIRSGIVLEMEETAKSGNVDLSNTTFLITAATILANEGCYEDALRILHASEHLECSALRLEILLKMDRVDLARKELKNMAEKDDDATLTQLATAWVNMAMGGEKIQDAYYIYQELIDKFGSTPLLLNGQAASFLGQAKFEEAEAALQEAMDKDSNNPDTLINLIVLSQQTGKPNEVYNRYLTQLKDSEPNHPFIQSYQQKESDFERMVKQYAVSA